MNPTGNFDTLLPTGVDADKLAETLRTKLTHTSA
jgi:hypothetical protein